MKEQKFARDIAVQALFNALELRDKGTAAHCQRAAMLALKLGQALCLTEDDLHILRMGALLHDVGKIGIPDHILLKPEPLDDEEWFMMRQHSMYGAELVRSIPEMQAVASIVSSHHERWDGTGYPDRLIGEKIPFLARICGLAEVLDSLLSDQPYRAAWPRSMAFQTMEKEAGQAFDPALAEAISGLSNEF